MEPEVLGNSTDVEARDDREYGIEGSWLCKVEISRWFNENYPKIDWPLENMHNTYKYNILDKKSALKKARYNQVKHTL